MAVVAAAAGTGAGGPAHTRADVGWNSVPAGDVGWNAVPAGDVGWNVTAPTGADAPA